MSMVRVCVMRFRVMRLRVMFRMLLRLLLVVMSSTEACGSVDVIASKVAVEFIHGGSSYHCAVAESAVGDRITADMSLTAGEARRYLPASYTTPRGRGPPGKRTAWSCCACPMI